MKPDIWCPGCSRHVEGVCHQFHCAIGPNAMGIKQDSILQERIIQRDYHMRMAKLLSDLIDGSESPADRTTGEA